MTWVPRAEEKALIAEVAAVKKLTSFRAFKRAMGSLGQGNVWHHIVEQRLESVFGAEAIHNTANVVPVKQSVNQVIADYYSSVQGLTGGLPVRQWLGGQSFEAQFQFGMDILNAVLAGNPLP